MEKVLMKGNEACAEAAIRAGCKCYFGYPITPQNEITAYMSKHLPKIGGVFVQAESEIGAINMVYGCAGSGERCMTSSSSPGISLKAEGISYLAGADLPCVIINIQRGGPGLGTIQPSQADYWQATKALGHGDLRIPVLAPDSVQEMADMSFRAFKIAEEYRTPVMILADGILGQMMEPVIFSDETIPKPNNSEWAANGHKNSRPKNIINSLYLDPLMLEQKIAERFERYEQIKIKEAAAVYDRNAKIVVAAYGSTARVARSAVDTARAKGIDAGLFRPQTLWPFPVEQLKEAAENAKIVLVTEMSMGQMVDDVKMSLEFKLPVEFFGRTGGFVPSPDEIYEKIKELEGKI